MSARIDRESLIPFYAQVKQSIKDEILQGKWQPGDQLPGETELCRIYSVSRTVIRQALNELLQEELIVRKKGRGTFITQPKVSERMIQKITGFYEDVSRHGFTPVSEVLKQHEIKADERIGHFLALEPGTPVIEIERLRTVEGDPDPIVLVKTYLPLALCVGLLDTDLTHRSLYHFLEQECGLILTHGYRHIEAVAAGVYEAGLLRVKRGTPLILLSGVTHHQNGTPVEYLHSLYRGDRARFDVELMRGLEPQNTYELVIDKSGSAVSNHYDGTSSSRTTEQ